MARESVRGEVRGERLASGNRPVGFLEAGRVVLHLQGGGKDGAEIGEQPETARKEVLSRFASNGVMVAGEAHAGGKRMGGVGEGGLRVEDHLGGGMGREARRLLDRGDAGDDAVAVPVVGQALVGDAAGREVERPGPVFADVADDAAQHVARHFQRRFHQYGHTWGHGYKIVLDS